MSHSHAQRMQYLQQQQQHQNRAAAHHAHTQPHGYPHSYQQRQPNYSHSSSHGQRPSTLPPQQRQTPRQTPSASEKSYPASPTGSQHSSNMPPQHPSRNTYSGSSQPYKPQRPVSGSSYHGEPPPTYDEHYSHSRPASMGSRSYSRGSMGNYHSHSRSLGASKASLATYRSGKSSIQQEYHDRRVQSQLTAIYMGRARTPFLIAIILFVIAFFVFFTGVGITIAVYFGNIFIPSDIQNAVGPIIIVIGILLACAGVKFIFDAYKISSRERRRFRFTARGDSAVSVNTVSSRVHEQNEQLASGTSTQNALTRTPVGSRTTLSAV